MAALAATVTVMDADTTSGPPPSKRRTTAPAPGELAAVYATLSCPGVFDGTVRAGWSTAHDETGGVKLHVAA
jgi:hypothetical protein